MNSFILTVSLTLGVVAMSSQTRAEEKKLVPIASPTPYGEKSFNGPVFSPKPQAVATPPVGAGDVKKLQSEFAKAQKNEVKALEHQQKIELSELKSSHKSRLREWELKEKETRHRFFVEHPNGPDRRTYVHDFIARRNAYLAVQAEEVAQRSHEQEIRRKALKDDQQIRLQEFQDFIKRGEHPPERLWPQPGR